jgi:hypothetical protein
MGELGFGMDNISLNVRCLRIGFVALMAAAVALLSALDSPSLSSAVATLGGGTGSTAVWRGPYSQVTSESLSLSGRDERLAWRF